MHTPHLTLASLSAAFLAAAPGHASQSHPALPHDTSEPAVAHVIDLRTGETTFEPLGVDPLAVSRTFHGTAPHAQELPGIPELAGDEWLLDLSAINSQEFPWSTQCRIFVDKAAGTIVGSGTIVGPRHVITAGHVVWDKDAGVWGSNVRVRPAWDGDSDAYGNAQAVRLASFANYTQGGDTNHDMGMIEFDRPVGFLTGSMGFAWDSDDSFYTSTLFNRAGYPGASTCYAGVPNQLYYGAGTFDSVTNTQLIADLYWSCIAGGMSGAGVYTIIGSSRYVHAVSRATGNVGSTPMTKYDTRMTQSKFDFFDQTFIPDSYPSNEMDLVPLAVVADTGGGPIGAGETLDGLEYVVGNASLFSDFIQSNTFVDVYLSEDDNVTTGDVKIGSHNFSNHFSALETFTVDVTSLPTLPADLASGTYWIGVHVKKTDADTGNNVTTGWDAAEIDVNARWPELPSVFKNINDSLYAPLDVAPWNNASLELLSLDPHSREDDPDGWCNAGQLAAPISPFSGHQNLEMGLAPGAASQLVSNGFIMALDGAGHTDLVLDFMVRDYGEESHVDDGIFLSEDGLVWEEIYADWGALPPTWTQVRGLDLTSTSVDTSGEFYLLFAQEDNTAFGAADGVSIDDIQIHPPGPELSITGLKGGGFANIHLGGGTPAGLGVLLLSVTGGGPIPSSLGPALVADPVLILSGLPLDAAGSFGFNSYIDPALTGLPIWFQGLDVSSGLLSNALALTIG